MFCFDPRRIYGDVEHSFFKLFSFYIAFYMIMYHIEVSFFKSFFMAFCMIGHHLEVFKLI